MTRMLRTLNQVKIRTHLWPTVSAKTNESYVKQVHPSADIDTKFANLRGQYVANITIISSATANFQE